MKVRKKTNWLLVSKVLELMQKQFILNINFDIIPNGAGKGEAVEWLRQLFNLPGENVIVAGDSGIKDFNREEYLPCS